MMRIQAKLREEFGFILDALSERTLGSAIEARMKFLGMPSIDDYVIHFTTSAQERLLVVEQIVVPETWFFRYPESFQQLQKVIQTRELTPTPGQPLRILCVPTSTGEEAYSLAMALLAMQLRPDQFEILAADVSRVALDQAILGKYRTSSLRETSPWVQGLQQNYLTITGEEVRVMPKVGASIRWQTANLIEPRGIAAARTFDAIFCRNLFIYLTDAARRQTLSNFATWLKPKGRLFMGHAEPIALMDTRFQSTGPAAAFQFMLAPTTPPSVSPPTPRATTPTPSIPNEFERVPQPAVVRDLLAEAQADLDAGRPAVAGPKLRELIASAPTSAAYTLLGLSEMMQDRLTEAGQAFHQALYLDPKNYDALIHSMALAERRGDTVGAENYRRRAARIREANS
ncbi:MAG: CheR family methyltransferase [Fimbriiglobus sp.]